MASLPWGRESSIGQKGENYVYRSEGGIYVKWEESHFLYLFVEQCVSALVLLQEVGGTMVYRFLIDVFSFGAARAVWRQWSVLDSERRGHGRVDRKWEGSLKANCAYSLTWLRTDPSFLLSAKCLHASHLALKLESVRWVKMVSQKDADVSQGAVCYPEGKLWGSDVGSLL